MTRFNTVAIVGVGLIGGSIGMAVRQRGLAQHVVGIGRRAASLRVAKKVGAATRTTLDIERGVADAELVFVCTPVNRIVDDVRRAAAACPPGTLITDAGSTKAQIVAALDGDLCGSSTRKVRFIGGHPLAGSAKSGPAHARADLFEGRVVVLTPTAKSPSSDVKRLERFWSALGARVIRMSPEKHDMALAATSHLPRLVAAALAGATPPERLELAATGWLDTTRIAAGETGLWQPIFAANRGPVLKALARFEKTLAALRAALEREDEQELNSLLRKAKRIRDAVGS